MKTILISGVYYCLSPNLPVLYDIDLWGQTETSPEITFITHLELSLTGYDELIKVCREKFINYFNCNDNNITHQMSMFCAKDYFKYNE